MCLAELYSLEFNILHTQEHCLYDSEHLSLLNDIFVTYYIHRISGFHRTHAGLCRFLEVEMATRVGCYDNHNQTV